MGLLYDDDNVSTTAATLAGFSVHDAFGNNMTASPLGKGGSQGGGLAKTGSFEWRGGEGSVTDRESGLVHMQARHYDPSIGRFLQADTLALASLTTQGTNRYLYTENDPVNMSDPSGHFLQALGLILLLGFVGGLINYLFLRGSFLGGFWGAMIATVGVMIGGVAGPLGVGLGLAVTGFFDGESPNWIIGRFIVGCTLQFFIGAPLAYVLGGKGAEFFSQLFWYAVNVAIAIWHVFAFNSSPDSETDQALRYCYVSRRRPDSRFAGQPAQFMEFSRAMCAT